MARRNGSGLRVVVLVGGLLGLAGLLAVVGVALRGQGLAVAANVAQLVSVGLAAPSLAVGLVVWWRRSAAPAVAPGTTEILRAKDVLAGLVAEQWKAEAAIRALDDPDPIPVRWRTPEQPPTLMDHQASIGPETEAEDGAWWTASSGEIAALVDRFRRTRRRRLVILGGPGMGKTTLAMQLLLHLLDTRTLDEPVPVLLPVAGWDTEGSHLHDWLADRLARDYPALRSPELGTGIVRALTARGHILPVLDGLDELPPPARAKMITALNSSLGDGQLILTSRTPEFATAVAQAGDVVTSAAVLEPLPLSPTAAADYLALWLPPSPGSGWQQILAELRTTPPSGAARGGPGAALAEVAATPLGLWLLRSVYSTPGTDPTELADPDRFPTPAAMRAHLFDQLIPALITARPPSEGPADPFRPRRRHNPANARRYLGYLADYLNHVPVDDDQIGTRDFAWWQLARHTLNRRTHRFAIGLSAGLVGGPVSGLVTGVALGDGLGSRLANRLGVGAGHVSGLGVGAGAGLVSLLGVGLASGLLGWFVASPWLTDTPGFAKLTRRPTSLSHLLKGGLVGALVGGLIFGLPATFAGGLAFGPAGGLAFGLVGVLVGVLGGGLGGGLLRWLIHWVETPTPADQANTPLITWRADRTLNLVRTIAGALAGGFLGGLAGGLSGGLAGKLATGLVLGLVSGLATGLGGGFWTGQHHASPMYVVATDRLARRRLLPRRLLPYLDDMHRLGLMRAVGPIYQFRHAELQDHLAAAYRSREKSSA